MTEEHIHTYKEQYGILRKLKRREKQMYYANKFKEYSKAILKNAAIN